MAELIVMQLDASHPRNIAWAKRRRLKRRPRWLIQTLEHKDGEQDRYGNHPVLSEVLFCSYRQAIAAIENWRDSCAI